MPLYGNCIFFIFTFLVVIIESEIEHFNYKPKYIEAFIDIYFLCLIINLFKKNTRIFVRIGFTILIYIFATAQFFCFHFFGTIITPTVIQIVSETNMSETSNFFDTYVTSDLLTSRIMIFPVLLILHSIAVLLEKKLLQTDLIIKMNTFLGCVILTTLSLGCNSYIKNKYHFAELILKDDIYEIEKSRNNTFGDGMYSPFYNIIYSVRANQLAYRQIDRLISISSKTNKVQCKSKTKNIVLVIGESYNKHHSQLYGYDYETTPNQVARQKKGELYPFYNVLSPWNLTSNAFRHLFSLYSYGDEKDWSFYPLFPALFKSAGYTVFFLSSQFAEKNSGDTSNFAGGFFINNKVLSDYLFSYRNKYNHSYDDGLIKDYFTLRSHATSNNLFIFHLVGQHYSYNNRYPRENRKFTSSVYKNIRINKQKKEIVADYDNATLYNDYILNEIIKLFEDKDCILVFLSDHGEEVYDDGNFVGRRHPSKLTQTIAKYEFEIPFWIWCSETYKKNNPNIIKEIKKSLNKKSMSDDLPHLLLYIGGIESPDYRADHNIISPEYHQQRPRLLRGNEEYDTLLKR